MPWPGALLQCSADSLSRASAPSGTARCGPPWSHHVEDMKTTCRTPFTSILVYFSHVRKPQSEENCFTRFEYFPTSLRWTKKKSILVGRNVSQSEILAQAKPLAKSHHIQSDTWFYSGLYTHGKWKFNYTFMHCYNPLFICSELLTFFCHASSIKVLFVRFNCPQASKSDVFFFALMMRLLLIESDYSTNLVTGGAGKVRPICVVLGDDENL